MSTTFSAFVGMEPKPDQAGHPANVREREFKDAMVARCATVAERMPWTFARKYLIDNKLLPGDEGDLVFRLQNNFSSGGGHVRHYKALLYYLSRQDAPRRYNNAAADLLDEWFPQADLEVRRWTAEELADGGGEQVPIASETDCALSKLLTLETIDDPQSINFQARSIDLVGREQEMATLREFAAGDGKPFSWIQISGESGRGKSRIALELCLELQSSQFTGFLVGRSLEILGRILEKWRPVRPTLIVVDGVSGREASVGLALQYFSTNAAEYNHSVRLILIEQSRWDRANSPFHNSRDNDSALWSTNWTISSWMKGVLGSAELNPTLVQSTMHETGVLELGPCKPADLIQICRFWGEIRAKESFGVRHDSTIFRDLEQIDVGGSPLLAYLLVEASLDGEKDITFGDYPLEASKDAPYI